MSVFSSFSLCICQCWSPLINLWWSVKWTDHHVAHGMYLCIVHVHNANNLLLHQQRLVVDPSAAALSSTAGQNKRMIRGHKHCAFQSDWLVFSPIQQPFSFHSPHSRIPSHSCTHSGFQRIRAITVSLQFCLLQEVMNQMACKDQKLLPQFLFTYYVRFI